MAATPMRPLPGAFMATPAPPRNGGANLFGGFGQPPRQQPIVAGAATQVQEQEKPIQRGARTINEALAAEARFPEVDVYTRDQMSNDYDIQQLPAWMPFQQVRTYQLPDRVLEQANRASLQFDMGLFAEIGHAWVWVDNALYLWDYTHPNPELLGYEDQPYNITAVNLVTPRAGVFIPIITHLLVVATTNTIMLLGIAHQRGPEGASTVELYQTHMRASVQGFTVEQITGASRNGRIFFSVKDSNDVWELTYQQEERWFGSKVGTVNHTSRSVINYINNQLKLGMGKAVLQPIMSLVSGPSKEFVVQMVVDDSRNLLYTLSNESTIRVFHMRNMASLDNVFTISMLSIRKHMTHWLPTESPHTMGSHTQIISISPIATNESLRLSLLAVTNTGTRIYLSATSATDGSSSLSLSMQVQHVKFPPGQPGAQQAMPTHQTQIGNYQPAQAIDTNSQTLTVTTRAARFAPGYFLCFVRPGGENREKLFLTTPDSARIAKPQEVAQRPRFYEVGQWMSMSGDVRDVGLVTPPFGPVPPLPSATGFGNEMAFQFDLPSSEFVIMTGDGIYTIRRRRLVDILAAAMQRGGGVDGEEAEIKYFVRSYGRVETCATALAVACGQASEVTSENRVGKLTDRETLDKARRAFIESGGKPTYNENLQEDGNTAQIDLVQTSPRHAGLALYMSRLVRSLWKAPIVREGVSATGGLAVAPSVSLPKLQGISKDLVRLREFLDTNKNFIDGLSGPEALGRVGPQHEQIALQGEHRALHSLVKLLTNIIEGISFVLALFDEPVDEVLLSLPDDQRLAVRNLTFENLFCSAEGTNIAKELVKAIVNLNIAKGSNVDTVADGLRRRCGSFCSPDDVIIFKAQEQLKQASELGANSDAGRAKLNESANNFSTVSASLSMPLLQAVIDRYIEMEFYAGAIRLALRVADHLDRGKKALSFVKDGSPENDPRQAAFESRKACYKLVYKTIEAVDEKWKRQPKDEDGMISPLTRRRDEAYAEINDSDDEVFQNDLYDWYISKGWQDRLLDITSPYVQGYLTRKSKEELSHADLLWKYYAHHLNFFEAAKVQAELSQSTFDLSLDQRIKYLSFAKSNASARSSGPSDLLHPRQSRQELLREINDLLDLANIQSDLLQRLRREDRITDERKTEIVKALNGFIHPVQLLYQDYAAPAGYYDIIILIFQAADIRNQAEIKPVWQNLFQSLHQNVEEEGQVHPWEVVAQRVRELGARLGLSDSTFHIPTLLPLLEEYRFRYQRGVGPPSWVVEVFLDLQVPHETLVMVLEGMFHNNEAPFQGRHRRWLADDIVHVIANWYAVTTRAGSFAFGNDDTAASVLEILRTVEAAAVLSDEYAEMALDLRARISYALT
ncbi:non-repetitive nucleoporin [Saccharata proteae CBS 121410]|uniref:Non-repetitive nucleoporin n=1 Tax=Saccharata proteae CBS 121410 TaxID=1314787 RepID=A0A9P4I437_9PEZI|nr:non-repetitive nucleoporin [Saccharata proteae CBS 121410]